jgi:hypothetical protein
MNDACDVTTTLPVVNRAPVQFGYLKMFWEELMMLAFLQMLCSKWD